jgi:predicted Zn finger-like uncharacterized protein
VEEVGVIIACPKCDKQYKYDEARFGAAKRKRLKCPKCSAVFEVENPAADIDDTSVGADKGKAPTTSSRTDEYRMEPEAPELPQLAPLSKDVRFSLAVIAGTQAGSVFQLAKPRLFLGRGSSMDIQLKDSEVSRRHAMLEIRGDVATLIDLGATNGTYVGGERIDRTELHNQSEFTLGSTTMMLIVTHSRDASV